jgi:hypothetical protein
MGFVVEDQPWAAEDEYVEYLAAERSRFAWVMSTYGGMSSTEANASAELCYPYPPPGPYWGLVFHDDTWHWVMLKLKGEAYGSLYPELACPPAAYHALDRDS